MGPCQPSLYSRNLGMLGNRGKHYHNIRMERAERECTSGKLLPLLGMIESIECIVCQSLLPVLMRGGVIFPNATLSVPSFTMASPPFFFCLTGSAGLAVLTLDSRPFWCLLIRRTVHRPDTPTYLSLGVPEWLSGRQPRLCQASLSAHPARQECRGNGCGAELFGRS